MTRTTLLSAASLLAVCLTDQAMAQRSTPTSATASSAPMMASVDTALLRGLNYRLVGHSRGGRVNTVTGVPSQPRTFYMGVASGGLFRTTDGGESWQPLTDGSYASPRRKNSTGQPGKGRMLTQHTGLPPRVTGGKPAAPARKPR